MGRDYHWYDLSGQPRHTQLSKSSGNERPTTIADARKQSLLPSVTSVIGIMDRWALNEWRVKQAIKTTLTYATANPRFSPSSEGSIAELHKLSEQQVKDAALEGSAIHDAIEMYFSGQAGAIPEDYRLHVGGVKERLDFLFPDVRDWVAERTFACRDVGFAGKVDLHSPSTGIVVDYKSKEFAPGEQDTKRFDYGQNYQLGAYQRGLGFGVGSAVGASIFVSRNYPGAIAHILWDQDEMRYGWSVFEKALALWKVVKKFETRLDI